MRYNATPIALKPCPKAYTRDLDKAASPRATVERVMEKLAATGLDIVSGTRRIDRGRLGIPVYLGLCGTDARAIMPTRKQMGKGSSAEQAQASALMELMERFAFFSFWQNPRTVRATWTQAEAMFGSALIPISEIPLSVHDKMGEPEARELMDVVEWQFYPATNIDSGRVAWLPLDWFRMLGEFNGSSAGNTAEESLLQGVCELVERHVSCAAVRNPRPLPTIRPESCSDAVFSALVAAFSANNIRLVLKDMSLGMALPTVAALAWDPATLGRSSEIVFTAGTASSPLKAAIRAITEVAQLAGDFCSNACYEASGLPKYTDLAECQWLLEGPKISLEDLPGLENADIYRELRDAARALQPINLYAVETTHPLLEIPAHYCIAPGLEFLERDRNQSLGLFLGRKLAEEAPPASAARGLKILARACPSAHYLPFFQGILALRAGNHNSAYALFRQASECQPDNESTAMATFYAGHTLTLMQKWREALPFLNTAANLEPKMKEYLNLLGVALFKTGNYSDAEAQFDRIIRELDKGSALDLANRGLCRKFQGNASAAAEDLRASLELDPGLDFARKHLEELESES